MLAQLFALLLGIWLMSAPGLLGYSGVVAAAHHVIGPLIASVAFVSLWEVTRTLRLINLVLGVALAVLTLILAWPLGPAMTGAAVGILVAVSATFPGRQTARYGGGWKSLLRPESK